MASKADLLSRVSVWILCVLVLSPIILSAHGIEVTNDRIGQADSEKIVIAIYIPWYPPGWFPNGDPGVSRSGPGELDRSGGEPNPNPDPYVTLFSPAEQAHSSNRDYLRWQVQMARRAGISAFAIIASAYAVGGPPDEREARMPENPYDVFIEVMESEGFPWCWLLWGENKEKLYKLMEKGVEYPHYLRIDGRPVVVWHGIVPTEGGSSTDQAIIDARSYVESKLGERIFCIGGKMPPIMDVFSLYLYPGYWDLMEVGERWRELSESGKPWAPTLIPCVAAWWMGEYHDFDANHYRAYWDLAREYPKNGSPEIYVICAWNEYFESTVLEPTVEFGTLPVDINAEEVGRISGPTTPTPTPTPTPAPTPTPGVVPDYIKHVPVGEILPGPSGYPEAYAEWLNAVGAIGNVDQGDIDWLASLGIDFYYYVNKYVEQHPEFAPPKVDLSSVHILTWCMNPSVYKDLVAAGVDAFEIDAYWGEHEPNEGEYDWSLIDHLVAEAERVG
ncbi:MAG: hypothetical protein ACE5OY_07780, partial [Candidatus Bathyarchaeia archaeon]